MKRTPLFFAIGQILAALPPAPLRVFRLNRTDTWAARSIEEAAALAVLAAAEPEAFRVEDPRELSHAEIEQLLPGYLEANGSGMVALVATLREPCQLTGQPPMLKAYRVNSDEVWAGYSAAGAVAIAIAETDDAGAYAVADARELSDEELDQPLPFDQGEETTTLREELAGMTEPGLLASALL